jgi:transposase
VAFRGGCNPAPAKARDAARIRPRTLQGAHLIEDFSCKLNQFRAIATRYDKTARNFLAAIHLATAIIWLN